MFRTSSMAASDAVRTYTALAQTCQQFYWELKRTPALYQTNRFSLAGVQDLHIFLAALTPQRRAAIRYLKVPVSVRDFCNDVPSSSTADRFPGYLPHVITLIRQCKDLREMTIMVEVMNGLPHVISALRSCRGLDRWPATRPGFWSMPQLKVLFDFQYRTILDLEDPMPNWENYPLGNHTDRVKAGFSLVQEKMALRKQRILKQKEDEQRRRMQLSSEPQDDSVDGTTEQLDGSNQTVSDPALRSALVASGIDFPGEDRIALDRFGSTLGPISARTRERCNGMVSDTGIIQKSGSKYNIEGLLNGPIVVFEIQLAPGDEIEVQVMDTANIGQSDTDRVWEPLHNLISDCGMTGIVRFYDRKLGLNGARKKRDLQAKLQELEQLILPAEILRLTNDLEIMRYKKVPDLRWIFERLNSYPQRYQERVDSIKKRLGLATQDNEEGGT